MGWMWTAGEGLVSKMGLMMGLLEFLEYEACDVRRLAGLKFVVYVRWLR
jgi:hypothetical protein